MSGTMGAVRDRCGREQAEALATAMKWGETPAMALLFAEIDRLELRSDNAAGVEGATEIARILSRAADELTAIAEQARDDAIADALSSCEFVDEESDPSVGWQGRDADEQREGMYAELSRDLPAVEDLTKAARRAGAGREA